LGGGQEGADLADVGRSAKSATELLMGSRPRSKIFNQRETHTSLEVEDNAKLDDDEVVRTRVKM